MNHVTAYANKDEGISDTHGWNRSSERASHKNCTPYDGHFLKLKNKQNETTLLRDMQICGKTIKKKKKRQGIEAV